MKRLFLLRHAKSSWDDPALDDFDRPLNARGRAAAAAIARYMAQRGIGFDDVLASPARRVKQTLEGIRDIVATPAPRFDETIYHASVTDLVAAIARADAAAERLLLVGHEPGLRQLATWLTAPDAAGLRDQVADHYPTAGLVEIHLGGDDWHLLPGQGVVADFVRPRDLA